MQTKTYYNHGSPDMTKSQHKTYHNYHDPARKAKKLDSLAQSETTYITYRKMSCHVYSTLTWRFQIKYLYWPMFLAQPRRGITVQSYIQNKVLWKNRTKFPPPPPPKKVNIQSKLEQYYKQLLAQPSSWKPLNQTKVACKWPIHCGPDILNRQF
jgi:hypothetical protein